MRVLWCFMIALLMVSCVNTSYEHNEVEIFERPRKHLVVESAKGFDIQYFQDSISIQTHSFGENSPFISHVILALNDNVVDATQELKKVCCQSSTHLAYLDALGLLDLVNGHCGLQYVQDIYRDNLVENGVLEVCEGEQTINEVLLSLDPDVYFTYPFGRESSAVEDLGITDLLIAEYLEEDPIARLEWIKLFGVLFQQEELADSIFQQKKEQYHALKEETHTKYRPTFIMNLPYGDSWHQPSPNSLIVSLIEDAGFQYLYADDVGTENYTFAPEKVWADGADADYWIIIANREEDYSIQQLIAEEKVYGSFNAVQNQQVIFCNSSSSNYFTKGVLEPEVMLEELISIREKNAISSGSYFDLLK